MYRRLLVPIDGSATGERGLEEAIRLATVLDGQIRLLHVLSTANVPRDGADAMVDASRCRAIAAGIGTDVRRFDGFDGSVDELIAAESRAWGADLVVMGTHGRHGLPRLLLGSDADRVVRLSRIPVLLVPDRDDDRV
jgi:nucleotide-binding universal stress UspA family protein